MVVSRPLSRLGRLLCGVAAAATALTPVAASAQQAKGLQLIRDTEIEETLHLECDPVFAAAGLNPKNTTILIQQDEFNAATANGQTLLIGTKIIEETENPNQLIGVMAHETGHAAGGHTARRGELERAGLGPMIISAGLGLLALAVAPEAGLALLTSAPMFGTLGALGFSREQEGRADQAAATYLELAGESGRGLVEFFDKFRYEEVFSEARRYAFFNDHPISGDRIELLRRRVEAQKHYAAVDGADLIARHETMKAKLKAFIGSPAQTFQLYPETDKSFNGRYARAIARYKAVETVEALKEIDALIADYPTNPYLYELEGQTYFESARPKESEAAYAMAVKLKPEASLLRVLYAQAILAQDEGKRADVAIPQLKKALQLEEDSALAWTLMAQAYDAKGDGGNARLASAEARFAVGDSKQARIFAVRARELLKKDSIEYRRATDIFLASKPTANDLKLFGEG